MKFKNIVEMINEIKSWICKDKALARIMKEKRKKAQINKIQNEREEITKDITESQKHKDYKRILRATIHQQTAQPGRNGYILRIIQYPKIK